jgi:hypothetical protein
MNKRKREEREKTREIKTGSEMGAFMRFSFQRFE